MKHWLALSVGLAIAAAALYLLAAGGEGLPGGPPLDRIDEESRERLERVLLEAERERSERAR